MKKATIHMSNDQSGPLSQTSRNKDNSRSFNEGYFEYFGTLRKPEQNNTPTIYEDAYIGLSQ
jgi:hypothetical protein